MSSLPAPKPNSEQPKANPSNPGDKEYHEQLKLVRRFNCGPDPESRSAYQQVQKLLQKGSLDRRTKMTLLASARIALVDSDRSEEFKKLAGQIIARFGS